MVLIAKTLLFADSRSRCVVSTVGYLILRSRLLGKDCLGRVSGVFDSLKIYLLTVQAEQERSV